MTLLDRLLCEARDYEHRGDGESASGMAVLARRDAGQWFAPFGTMSSAAAVSGIATSVVDGHLRRPRHLSVVCRSPKSSRPVFNTGRSHQGAPATCADPSVTRRSASAALNRTPAALLSSFAVPRSFKTSTTAAT